MPKPIYLSPLFSTPAVVAGSGVSVLCTLYPQTANTLDPQHPGLNCIDPGDSTVNVYNAADVTAMGAYLVGQGVSRIVFDWETTDTPGNRAVVLQILTGLRASGLRVDLWDVDVTNTDLADWKVANSQDGAHVVSYPLANDSAVWLANTGPYVAAAKARYPTKDVYLWIAPKSTEYPPGPPSPPPWGTYSETALRTYLSFGRDTAAVAAVVVWWSPSAAGATAPWDATDPAWGVIREYAEDFVPSTPVSTLYNAIWTLLESGAATPPLVLPGNRINRGNRTWRMRDATRMAANDFPKIEMEVGVSGGHSAWGYDETFASESTDFLNSDVPFDIERTEEVYIRITENKPTDESSSALREAVIDDIMRGGPRLGLDGFVWRIGRQGETRDIFRVRRRDARKDETDPRGNAIPFPGTITEIRFIVVCQENGRASLVA
jgi:hypothetical protein